MKPAPFAYHAPDRVDAAVALLAELGDDGKVLAGGQSLVPVMNMRLARPAGLVDIVRLDDLDRIEVTPGAVRIGARTRQARVHRDEEVARALPILRQALSWVAHPVIRNRGTVVGSIVHADPAAELPAVLALLGGSVALASTAGVRTVPAEAFFVGPLESDTRPDELAVATTFTIPPARTGSAFVELARRHGDYAVAGVGVTVTLDGDHRVTAARAAFIGVGPVPVVIDLRDALAGQPHDALDTGDAVATARAGIEPGDDLHATAGYRRHLAGVLLDRALRDAARAAHRAGEPSAATDGGSAT